VSDKVLTLEIAASFLNDLQGNHFTPLLLPHGTVTQLDLSSFGHIAVDAARHLVSHCTQPIRLGSLRSVSLELANTLAQHNNTYVLGNAATLSADLAKALASQRNFIIVESSTDLSLAAAKELLSDNLLGLSLSHLSTTFIDAVLSEYAAFRKGICPLYSLRIQSDERLDERSGTALGSLRNLYLDNVHSLDEKAAKGLSHVSGSLSLNGLREISEGVASAFGEMTVGELCLDGIQDVSDPVASLLFRRHGGFSLNGLRALSQVAAQELGRTSGYLHLNSLKHITDEAAVALAERDGQLSLDGLVELSAKAATALGKQKVDKGCGSLSFSGLTHLTPSTAKGLANAKHYSLNLSGLTTLDLATAKELADSKAKKLDLGGLREISADAALELIGYRGRLSIDDDNFQQLSADARRVLGKHRSLRSMA
jgi:hypothetical protein